jgi:hypothetical protein
MADNMVVNAGVGGDTVALDDIGGVKFQRVKIVEGADGVNDGDICAANPLPVAISDGTDTALVDASGQLGVVEANSAAIKTAVELIDNAISGNEMQVDIVAALPAGTNAIGKLTSNSGVDIGDVTINNTTGANAVNIQDGGNSITIDDGGGSLTVDDGGGTLTIDGSVSVSGEVDVTPAAPSAEAYLPVRVTNGSAFGLQIAGWDDSNPISWSQVNGQTTTDPVTLLAADPANKYVVTDISISAFTGTTAPAAGTHISVRYGSTEIERIYVPPAANQTIASTFNYSAPPKSSATNTAITAVLSASLGTSGEYSAAVHAYKTSS